MSSSSPSLSSRIIPIIILAHLSIFGLDALLLQLDRNGFSDLMHDVLNDPLPRFLPDTERLILKQYVGIPALDYFFAFTNVFWANVTDGSSPALSLFIFCFGGQLIAIFLVFMIESKRTVNWSGLVLNWVVWGFLTLALGFGFIAPLFYLIHLIWTSKATRSQSVHVRDHLSLHTVVPSFLLGWIVPCIFVAYPFSNHNVRQWSIAVWSIAPVYVFICEKIFTTLLRRLSVGQDAAKPKVTLDKAALSSAYSFAWNFAVVCQLTTYAVLIAAYVAPGVFPDGVAKSLTLEKVFVPDAAPHSYRRMTSPASAVQNFLIYDLATGSIAAIVWALKLLLEVRPELAVGEERTNLARGVLTSILLSGPMGAAIALLQHRDESVLSAEAKAVKIQ
ncbi:hypothetical protein FSARC_10659 [Fusarium sarcochroum]|uniref:Uncharacterized protein n=1 Tax=Fusarium sarcochroum TaxID=1208366 RepID=A0A8H4X2M2_9HYPO|nr:hypothetical protein FSARC_10659 [Fusarium sarcochroum]